MTVNPLSLGQRVQAAAIASMGFPLLASLGLTMRWHVSGYEHYKNIRSEARQPIFAFWHGRILPATWYWRNRQIVVMTSENFDGEWIAKIIQRFGYGVARGSTSKGGARALAKLRREMRDGKPAAFSVDGPRGPLQQVQPGAVWLSRLTGNPILPFHIEASRHWTMTSWDKTQIPKPFARVAVAIGEPLTISSSASDVDIESSRMELERRLLHLVNIANRMVEK